MLPLKHSINTSCAPHLIIHCLCSSTEDSFWNISAEQMMDKHFILLAARFQSVHTVQHTAARLSHMSLQPAARFPASALCILDTRLQPTPCAEKHPMRHDTFPHAAVHYQHVKTVTTFTSASCPAPWSPKKTFCPRTQNNTHSKWTESLLPTGVNNNSYIIL